MKDSDNEDEYWPEIEVGYYGRPFFGERVSGDWAFSDQKEEWIFLAMVDGLGHGKNAHQIAQLAKEFLTQSWSPDVTWTLNKLHKKLQGTGGAAVGLASINLKERTLHYVGIGNTVFRKIGTQSGRLLSREGVVGVRMRNPSEQLSTIKKSDIILMYTDGISESFDLEKAPQIRAQSAGLAAKTIVRKFGSPYDDSTCLVLKVKHEN